MRIIVDEETYEEVDISNGAAYSKVFPADLSPGVHTIRIEGAASTGPLLQQEEISFSVVDSEDDFHDVRHYDEIMGSTPTIDDSRGFTSGIPLKGVAILYHKQARLKYEDRWIEKCIESILNQNYPFFDIVELNYGGEYHSFMQQYLHRLEGKRYTFFSRDFQSHAVAMNFLLDWVFSEDYDVAFNVNLDDYYSPDRFKLQVETMRRGWK